MSWTESLATLLADVANVRSGQVGSVLVNPPDIRVGVQMYATTGIIKLTGSGLDRFFDADQAAEAVSAYASAVEGCA